MNNFGDKTVKQMSRLKPINKRPQKQNIFHNMAFVIFCPKHRKIAVSDNFDTQRELAIWLPFVYLSSESKTRITVEESITLILSDGNIELMELYRSEQPFDSIVPYVWSTRLKQFKFGFTRTVCSVRLHSDNPVLQCCRKTSRIIWLDIEQILNSYMDCLWGPQLLGNYIYFEEDFQRKGIRFTLDTTIFTPEILRETDQNVLKSLNITEKQIHKFYIDFIEHCFPSIIMSFVSFEDYLRKYGFKTSQKLLMKLFNGFMYWHYDLPTRDYLDFEELLLGSTLNVFSMTVELHSFSGITTSIETDI